MSKGFQVEPKRRQPNNLSSWKTIAFTAVLSAGVVLISGRHLASSLPASVPNAMNYIKTSRRCRPPLPNLFADEPVRVDQPDMQAALQGVDSLLRKAFVGNQIDGLAVGIVTAKGAIYETGLGVLKANETDPQKRGVIDRNSIFRIASGSKLFVALEAWILEEKGALRW
jgi:CubicO group peptidase (beta-lactamase class C family)